MDLVSLANLIHDPNLVAILQALPDGVKNRCGQGISRLTGHLTRHLKQKEKQEEADIDDDIKRDGNKTDTQQQVLKQLVPDIAKHISGDPDLLERAIIEVMGGAYRKQENRDTIAKKALKDIQDKCSDSSEDDDLLDEDWLNIFSSYAEKASSERTRQLWGRILSGEVRHPGRFSLSTLRILSEIGPDTARTFMEIAPFVCADTIFLPKSHTRDHFPRLMELHEAGLITTLSPLERRFERTSDGDLYMLLENKTLIKASLIHLPHFSTVKDFGLPSYPLSRAGRELLKTIDYTKDEILILNALEDSLKETQYIKSYKIFIVEKINDNGISIHDKPIRSWELP